MITPFPWGSGGIWTPCYIRFFGPIEPATQTACRSVQPFLHRLPQSVPILYNGTPLPLKIVHSQEDVDSYLYSSWFLRPPESPIQTASRWLQPFLQGSLVCQTDRQTDTHADRPTDHANRSVGNNRPHLYSTQVHGLCRTNVESQTVHGR